MRIIILLLALTWGSSPAVTYREIDETFYSDQQFMPGIDADNSGQLSDVIQTSCDFSPNLDYLGQQNNLYMVFQNVNSWLCDIKNNFANYWKPFRAILDFMFGESEFAATEKVTEISPGTASATSESKFDPTKEGTETTSATPESKFDPTKETETPSTCSQSVNFPTLYFAAKSKPPGLLTYEETEENRFSKTGELANMSTVLMTMDKEMTNLYTFSSVSFDNYELNRYMKNPCSGQLELNKTIYRGECEPSAMTLDPSERYILYMCRLTSELRVVSLNAVDTFTDEYSSVFAIDSRKNLIVDANDVVTVMMFHPTLKNLLVTLTPRQKKIALLTFNSNPTLNLAYKKDLVSLPSSKSTGLAFSTDGKIFYVGVSDLSEIHVFGFDAATLSAQLKQKMPMPSYLGFAENSIVIIQLHPNGNILYALPTYKQLLHIFKIDQSTGQLTSMGSEIVAGESTSHMAITPDGSRLIVSNRGYQVNIFSTNQTDGSLTTQSVIIGLGATLFQYQDIQL